MAVLPARTRRSGSGGGPALAALVAVLVVVPACLAAHATVVVRDVGAVRTSTVSAPRNVPRKNDGT